MRRFVCIESFQVDKYVDDNHVENEYVGVPKHSMWEYDENSSCCVTGSDIRLDMASSDSSIWIEIPTEAFERCFKELGK